MPSDLEKIKVDSETGYRLKYKIPYKEIFYPKDAKPLKVSPYYKKIFVNKNGEEIDSRDESFSEREEKYILVYPLEVVNYFVRENLDVSNIFSEKTAEKTIKFIYPKNNLKIIVPKDFDGEKSLIVKIANIKNQEIYWYVNKEYAGKSREKERSFNLKKGNYEITVVSEKGETAKINFQVTEK